MTESAASLKWLRGLLGADSTLVGLLGAPLSGYTYAIYDSVAPEKAPFPFVIIQAILPGLDHVKLHMATTVMSNLRFTIKAVLEDQKTARANEVADRIALLLKNKSTNADGYGMNVFQIESFSFPEDDGGKMFQHAGGIYEVIVRPETL